MMRKAEENKIRKAAIADAKKRKLGKVNVRHLLNTRIKPTFLEGDKTELYPVYIRILFNRKSNEIKSNYHNFYHPEDDPGHSEPQLLSKQQFATWTSKTKHWDPFSIEADAVASAIHFYAQFEVNAVTEDPALLISTATKSVRSLMSHELKFQLWNALVEIKQELALLINWEMPYFDFMYDTLLKNTTTPIREGLKKFQPQRDMYQFLKDVDGEFPIMIYEWDRFKTRLNSKTPVPEYLKQVQEIIELHYSVSLKATHPALLKKILRTL